MIYATKKVKSGRMAELFIYPVQACGRSLPCGNESREAQARYNYKRSGRELVQLVNTNFDEGDIWMHPTFEPQNAPKDEREARRILQNYFRRVSAWRKKNGYPAMKYIYVIEEQVYKTGIYAGMCNYHYHLWMSEMPRDVAEELWGKGLRVNANRFQPDRFGQEAAAKYVRKAPKGIKKWVCSRNCERPKVSEPKVKDISRRKIQAMAEDHCDDARYWERLMPGYKFCELERTWNEYNGRWYLRVAFRKPLPPPRPRKHKKKVKR